MQTGIFTYGLLAALAIALLVAAFTDFRRRQIDNWLNAGIAAGAPLFWLASGMGWMDVAWQLGIALATFIVLAVLFAIRAMGGGDVKLLTALALWIKPAWFLQLLVVMAIAGGVLTIVFGCWHVIRRRRERIAIPYGIAIAGAGLWVIASRYVPAVTSGGLVG
ncbi:MAG TPA: prepilin peptidase [Novosphingobium sp.]|nr:prepilin peptidase [Novosphingobium sp.]HMP57494.1 prepilin peptidase [Novosphingobium sp.]